MKILSALVLLFVTQPVFAASFDCKKAATLVETSICENAKLSSMDEKLAALYQESLRVNPNGSAIVKQQQIQWLKSRNQCQTVACIQASYEKRLSEIIGTLPNRITPPSSTNSHQTSDWTGSYQQANAVINIIQRGSRIDFSIDAQWLGNPKVSSPHVGTLCEGATVDGNKMYFEDKNLDCVLRFSLEGDKLEVDQEGSCSFGMNVTATGTYRKRPAVTPKLSTAC